MYYDVYNIYFISVIGLDIMKWRISMLLYGIIEIMDKAQENLIQKLYPKMLKLLLITLENILIYKDLGYMDIH